MDFVNPYYIQPNNFQIPLDFNYNWFGIAPEYIFNEFCLCDVYQSFQQCTQPVQGVGKGNSKGNRSIETYDFSKQLQDLYATVQPMLGSSLAFTKAAKKSQACSRKKISKRRSQYTGVTRNSSNYQTLIVIKGKKTYVGSYTKEICAAITFDFYSILLHGSKATTNFAYTADEVMKMIDNYTTNNHTFEPNEFISHTNTISI